MTLYRKVFTKDRLPEDTNRYVYFTNLEEVLFSLDSKEFFHIENSCLLEPEWFLEEFELPKPEKYFYNYTLDQNRLNDMMLGANYILNKLKG